MHEMRLFLAVVRPYKPALPPLWGVLFFFFYVELTNVYKGTAGSQ